jgi:predicted transcriptional regulator
MSTAKKEVKRLLNQLPDEASYEEIQYHIYVRQKIEHGLKDVEEGRVLTQEAVERRMAKWLGK